MVVNRVCGSGLQAVVTAAMEIQSGYASCVLAGGMENMDKAPYIMPNGRYGARMGDTTLYDAMLMDGLNDAFTGSTQVLLPMSIWSQIRSDQRRTRSICI